MSLKSVHHTIVKVSSSRRRDSILTLTSILPAISEITTLAAAEILYEMLSIMALTPLDKKPVQRQVRPDAKANRDAAPHKNSEKAGSYITHQEL
jgi:hypothetical protein